MAKQTKIDMTDMTIVDPVSGLAFESAGLMQDAGGSWYYEIHNENGEDFKIPDNGNFIQLDRNEMAPGGKINTYLAQGNNEKYLNAILNAGHDNEVSLRDIYTGDYADNTELGTKYGEIQNDIRQLDVELKTEYGNKVGSKAAAQARAEGLNGIISKYDIGRDADICRKCTTGDKLDYSAAVLEVNDERALNAGLSEKARTQIGISSLENRMDDILKRTPATNYKGNGLIFAGIAGIFLGFGLFSAPLIGVGIIAKLLGKNSLSNLDKVSQNNYKDLRTELKEERAKLKELERQEKNDNKTEKPEDNNVDNKEDNNLENNENDTEKDNQNENQDKPEEYDEKSQDENQDKSENDANKDAEKPDEKDDSKPETEKDKDKDSEKDKDKYDSDKDKEEDSDEDKDKEESDDDKDEDEEDEEDDSESDDEGSEDNSDEDNSDEQNQDDDSEKDSDDDNESSSDSKEDNPYQKSDDRCKNQANFLDNSIDRMNGIKSEFNDAVKDYQDAKVTGGDTSGALGKIADLRDTLMAYNKSFDNSQAIIGKSDSDYQKAMYDIGNPNAEVFIKDYDNAINNWQDAMENLTDLQGEMDKFDKDPDNYEISPDANTETPKDNSEDNNVDVPEDNQDDNDIEIPDDDSEADLDNEIADDSENNDEEPEDNAEDFEEDSDNVENEDFDDIEDDSNDSMEDSEDNLGDEETPDENDSDDADSEAEELEDTQDEPQDDFDSEIEPQNNDDAEPVNDDSENSDENIEPQDEEPQDEEPQDSDVDTQPDESPENLGESEPEEVPENAPEEAPEETIEQEPDNTETPQEESQETPQEQPQEADNTPIEVPDNLRDDQREMCLSKNEFMAQKLEQATVGSGQTVEYNQDDSNATHALFEIKNDADMGNGESKSLEIYSSKENTWLDSCKLGNLDVTFNKNIRLNKADEFEAGKTVEANIGDMIMNKDTDAKALEINSLDIGDNHFDKSDLAGLDLEQLGEVRNELADLLGEENADKLLENSGVDSDKLEQLGDKDDKAEKDKEDNERENDNEIDSQVDADGDGIDDGAEALDDMNDENQMDDNFADDFNNDFE